MKKKSPPPSIEEQRAKIKQIRLELADPQLKVDRIAREKIESEEKAERHAAIAKDKLEKWMMLKMLKGEWNNDFRKKPIDVDDWAKQCSVHGKVTR